ncbi:MAG: hypothetical protein K2Q20_06575, partial [Phycisphaerales bacterium]|nr:hypothetical protein [Phycisphaerales bacterium]
MGTLSIPALPDVWAPDSDDDTLGGPDSVNPLLTADGRCALDMEWPEERDLGVAGSPGVLASAGVHGRFARQVHERASTRRVSLSWSAMSGADLELVRRAMIVTRFGAGTTRFRHPLLDPAGPVATAPKVRFLPGSLRVARVAGGAAAQTSVTLEYLDAPGEAANLGKV